MRRLFILSMMIVAGLFMFSADVSAQKLDAEGNQLIEAIFVGSPPTIDGVLSPGEWDRAESNTVDFVNLGVSGDDVDSIDGPEDCSYTFSVMYDSDFLYIAVSVTDDVYISTNYGKRIQYDLPVTWENDAVEYFFDGDLSRSETARNPTETETGGQFIYGIESDDAPDPFVSPELYGEKVRPFGNGADDDWYAQTTFNADTADWSQEARFALDIIGSPQPGGTIGFNINVDDVDVYNEQTLVADFYEEAREIQLYWTAFLYDPGMNLEESIHELEYYWGSLKFLEATALSDWPLY